VPGRRLAADDATSKWTLTHDRPVADAMFAPPHNNRNPVLTMDGKNVHVWTDETKVDLLGHEDWVTKMAASADGSHFVTASSDGTARVWLVDMAAPVAVLRGHRGAVKHAHFIGGDKQRVLTIGADGQSFLWLLHPTQLLSYTRNKWALGAAFSPDGRRVMLAYENGASVMSLPVDESQAPGEPLKLEDAEDVGLARLSWRPDGQMMLGVQSSSKAFVTNVLQVFAADSGKHLWPGQPSDLFLGTFAPKGFDLLTSNRNGQLQVWDSRHLDAPDLKPLQQFAGPGLGTTAIALSADGRWVAAASEGVIRLWARDKPTDPPLTLQGHEGDVVAMTFSPDSQHLLSASADRTARIWHLQPGGPRPDVLEGNASALTSAAFDATGEKVLTGNARGGIDVWAFHPQQSRPADRLQRMTSLRWHTEMVNSVAFSPDGQWILSASDDGSVRRGTCKTCWMSVAALQDKAANEALVPPAELRKIEQQSHGQIARMLERARSPSQ
jgi:WD40 repeat protein